MVFDECINMEKQLERVKEKIEKGIKIIRILNWKKMNMWMIYYAWMTYVV